MSDSVSSYSKGIALNCGFDLGAKALLDHRCIVADYDELVAIPASRRANGLLVWVQNQLQLYSYDELSGAWVSVDSSSSSSSSGSDADYSACLSEAKAYTDTQISTLTADAPDDLNSFKEVSDAISDIKDNLVTTADKVTLSSTDENLSSTTDVKAALEKIAAKVWYTKITITSFTASPKEGLYETGATVSKPTLTWATSKTPTKTTINGTTVTGNSYTLSANITAAKTVTLAVTESEGNTVSASKAWSFGYALYTGMATVPSSFTQDWIKSTLGGKAIKTSAAGTYTMKGSTASEYWWIVAPTAWTLKFSTTLGEGGAEQVGTLASFVNDQGKTVPMTIYRASKVQGSDMKITVS